MTKTIGLLGFSYNVNAPNRKALFDELRDTYGWSEKAADPDNRIIVVTDDRVTYKDDDEIARKLIELNPDLDVILACGFRIHNAINATSEIPIVMAPATGNPDNTIFDSSGNPGNVTGITVWKDKLADGTTVAFQRVNRFHDRLNKLTVGHDRIATLRNASKANTDCMEDYYAIRANLPVLPSGDVHPDWSWSEKDDIEVRLKKNFDKVDDDKRPHGLIVIGDFPAYWMSNRNEIVRAVNPKTGPGIGRNLPTLYPNSSYVGRGGFMSYGPSLLEVFKRVAYFVDQVLDGKKPSDIEWESPDDDCYEEVIDEDLAAVFRIDTAGARVIKPVLHAPDVQQ